MHILLARSQRDCSAWPCLIMGSHFPQLLLVVQASVQAWKAGPVSAVLRGQPRLDFADAASLTSQTLLHGGACSLSVEHAKESAPPTLVPASCLSVHSHSPLTWESSVSSIDQPRRCPRAPGTAVAIRYQHLIAQCRDVVPSLIFSHQVQSALT